MLASDCIARRVEVVAWAVISELVRARNDDRNAVVDGGRNGDGRCKLVVVVDGFNLSRRFY